jgi:hypothetical protein
MYVLVIIAFAIYIAKVPERWFVGKVDWCGHSHNWWHLFVLAALYYWHNSGKFLLFQSFSTCLKLTFTKIARTLHTRTHLTHLFTLKVQWPLPALFFTKKHDWRWKRFELKGLRIEKNCGFFHSLFSFFFYYFPIIIFVLSFTCRHNVWLLDGRKQLHWHWSSWKMLSNFYKSNQSVNWDTEHSKTRDTH